MTRSPNFNIRYDLDSRGEAEVALFKPGTVTAGERIPLSEAERRGIVPKEQAEHAHKVNQRIREAVGQNNR